jgi:hypothetical protein
MDPEMPNCVTWEVWRNASDLERGNMQTALFKSERDRLLAENERLRAEIKKAKHLETRA